MYDFSLQTNVFINSLKYECYNFDCDLNFKFATDPKQKSKRTLRYMEDNYIPRWPTPPQSPDLNPIENIWGLMKEFLVEEWKPNSAQLLVEGIHFFWEKRLTLEIIQKRIWHLHKVLRMVVAANGKATGV